MRYATDQKWATAELERVSRVFTDGNWIETKDQASEGIRLVQTGNVGEGVFKDRRDKARWIDDQTFDSLNCFEVLPGDCLVSRLPDPVGRACIIPETGDKMITAVDCTVIRPDEAKIDPQFFVYYSQSSEYLRNVDDRCTGTTRRRISRKNLGKIPIPLPPLEEQQRIVAVLDEAFEGLACARTNAKANLQNAQELFGSALQAALYDETISWNETVLADLGDVITGSTPKTSDKGNLGDHLPFVKPGDFLPDGSLVYDNQGLSKQGAAVSRVLPGGSALMVCIGATIGKSGYSDRPIATNQQINAVVPKDGVSGEYLYYQLLTPEFQADVMRQAGQATLPIINKGKWSKLKVRMPNDLTKQAAIVEQLSSIRARVNAVSSRYEAQILDLDDLRQSLLQKAFAGELV